MRITPSAADFVAKLFLARRRERLIQDGAPKRNIDSKARAAGFDYFKFQFHRLQLATFATKSARSGTPLPGALPLSATGPGLIALLTWRKRRRAPA
jgi:hypothetical protein